MSASDNRSLDKPAAFTAVMGNSAPHLIIFTVVLLLLLYGYEIFNFSLSIDEELYGSRYEANWWILAIAQGRWSLGLLDRIFPPIGDLPVIATVIFCAGLGLSAVVLARVLFREHSAQLAFAAVYLSFPLWPHLAEFNVSSWQIGIGHVLITLALLFLISDRRSGAILAALLVATATGIYQSLYPTFLALLCLQYLSTLLDTGSVKGHEEAEKFPWLRSGLVAAGGLLGYVAIERLFLIVLSVKLTYIQGYVRLDELTNNPSVAISRMFQRTWQLLTGSDPIFLGHGRILVVLPLTGLLIVLLQLFWRKPLKPWQRALGGITLLASFSVALSLLIISAGYMPTRALTSWIPICAFLSGFAILKSGRWRRLLSVVLAAMLLVSIWASVSLFYTDHIARQRDEVLAARIMVRIDNLLPNPGPAKVPFVVIGAVPAKAAGPFRKLEIFGDSFFDSAHEGGSPWRVAAYLQILGVDMMEPHSLEELAQYRQQIVAMPVWPAAGSIAMINGVMVIKLGPLTA